MKRVCLLIAVCCVLSWSARATEQCSDILYYKGDTLMIRTYPLEDYFEKIGSAPNSLFDSYGWSSCLAWGYCAYWMIRNDSLFLVDVRSAHNDRIPLSKIVTDRETNGEPVFADWFSGELDNPQGKEIYDGGRLAQWESVVSIDYHRHRDFSSFVEHFLEDYVQLPNQLYKNKVDLSSPGLSESDIRSFKSKRMQGPNMYPRIQVEHYHFDSYADCQNAIDTMVSHFDEGRALPKYVREVQMKVIPGIWVLSLQDIYVLRTACEYETEQWAQLVQVFKDEFLGRDDSSLEAVCGKVTQHLK